MICEHCGKPSSTPTCDRCQGYQAWASSSHGDNQPSSERVHRGKLLAELRRHLAEIPELYVLLPLFTQPGSGTGEPPPGGNPSRPPLNLDTIDLLDIREKPNAELFRRDSDLDRRDWQWQDRAGRLVTEPGRRRQGVLPVLTSWVRVFDEELDHSEGYQPPWAREACCGACTIEYADHSDLVGCCVGSLRPHPWSVRTVVGECSFLAQHVDWAAKQQWFDELVADVKRVRRDLQGVTGERDEVVDLPCTLCGWQMRGMGDYDADRGRHPWYQCTGCDKAITTQAELDRVQRKARDVVTLRYAATEVDRPLSTLKEWRQQGLIQPVGRDSRGSLYSLASITKVKASVKRGAPVKQARRDYGST